MLTGKAGAPCIECKKEATFAEPLFQETMKDILMCPPLLGCCSDAANDTLVEFTRGKTW